MLCATRPPGGGHSATAWLRLQRAQCSRHGEPGTPGRQVPAPHTRGQRGWDRAVRWGGRSFACFFSHPADTRTAEVDSGLLGSHRGECTATPVEREGAVLQGVVIDEAVERLCECARDLRGSTGARAIPQALDTLIGTAMHPCAQGSLGKLERVRDVWQARSFDDVTAGLGATEDAPLFGLLEHRLSRGQSRRGKVELKRPPRGPLLYKLLRKL